MLKILPSVVKFLLMNLLSVSRSNFLVLFPVLLGSFSITVWFREFAFLVFPDRVMIEPLFGADVFVITTSFVISSFDPMPC